MTKKNSEPKRRVGKPVDLLPPGSAPDQRPLPGLWVRLDRLDAAKHGDSLFRSFHQVPGGDDLWTYLAYGPFPDQAEFASWLASKEISRDPWFYALVNRASGQALGMAAFLRNDPANGVIEIGHIWLSPALQRSREASEAIFLMIRHAFDDLGVRRLEWKCDALNKPSRRAAERFGFVFEGVFRQHMIIKGRNRDTAWYAILDEEWPRVRRAFEVWLDEGNFDAQGKQKAKLRAKA